MSSKVDVASDIPKILSAEREIEYERLPLYGKVGFAKCYDTRDTNMSQVNAGRQKAMVTLDQNKKIVQEIAIRSLSHLHIARFLSYFDVRANVYNILELSPQCSMMELHRHRQVVNEVECRFFIHQILNGVKYLHEHHICHRDLRLRNLLLNDQMHVKIGGLVTRIAFDGERRKTLCGTLDYVAPEILNEAGHSYEVDIWSVGCVMYTLLVGQPPFKSKSLKDTDIRNYDYRLPPTLCKRTADMISAMLQPYPEKRPTVQRCLAFPFLNNQEIAERFPITCLLCRQLEDGADIGHERRPLYEVDDNNNQDATYLREYLNDAITRSGGIAKNNHRYKLDIEILLDQLTNLLNGRPKRLAYNLADEDADPAAEPLFWVSTWVDYSDKFGFGYQLCDNSMGVIYNDASKLILLSNGINVQYIDCEGREEYMTLAVYPRVLENKMSLLLQSKRYMTENLAEAGGNANDTNGSVLSRIPHMHTWFRTKVAVVMYLTTGSVQMNFFDHWKILLCPRMRSVTYIDSSGQCRTFKFDTIRNHGCSNGLYTKLRYAHEKLKVLLRLLTQ